MRWAGAAAAGAWAAVGCSGRASAFVLPATVSRAGCRAMARGGWRSSRGPAAVGGLRMAAEAPRLEEVPETLKNEIFIFKEEETGRVVECYPDVFAVVNGQKYLVGHPCDWCVSIGRPDAEGNLEPIPLEGDLMDEVFSTLQTMLEEDEVHLFRTPVTLTLQGEFLEDGDDADEDPLSDDEDGYDDVDEADDDRLEFDVVEVGEGPDSDDLEVEDLEPTDIDADNVELIASFWHEGAEYSLVRHMDPILLVAKPGSENDGRYSLVSESEAAEVNPVLETLLESQLL